MKQLIIVYAVICYLGTGLAVGQVAPDCGNAVPICNNTPVNGGTQDYGIDDFGGETKSGCLERTLDSGVIESNSAWYRFRTGASGQLGFNIGIDSNEDWDFALYKASDCGSLETPVRCNFYDNREKNSFFGVGEDPTGSMNNVQYEAWLEVAPGEDYYLLVNNFSNINSGFSIQFTGNIFETNPYDALDCSIISNLLGPPVSACENENLVLDASTINAVSYSWYKDVGNGLSLIPGETMATYTVTEAAYYRVEVHVPSQSNIISDVQVGISPAPTTNFVTSESLCSDQGYIDLNTKDIEALGGQSPEKVLITYHTSTADAVMGRNALDKNHNLLQGEQTLYVRATSAQNPNCIDVSQDFIITTYQPLVSDFPLEVFLCEGELTAVIGDTTPLPEYNYSWNTGAQTASLLVSDAGDYTLRITDKLGMDVCDNTITISVYSSKPPSISEVLFDDLKDLNNVTVVPGIMGDFEYRLDDGEYQESNVFYGVLPGEHTVTINDLNGCGAITETIVVVGYLRFFSPNGDGMNETWSIDGIATLMEPVVYVYDRYGKLLKQITQDSEGWDGIYNGLPMPADDYWFKLSFVDKDGSRVIAKYINNHFSLKR